MTLPDDHSSQAPAGALRFEHTEQLLELAKAMVQRSGRYLDWVLGGADLQAYDSAELAQAVTGLVVANPHSRVRLLLRGADGLGGRAHRLLDLAGRLPSYLEIRRLAGDSSGDIERMLVADCRHLILFSHPNRCEGTACYDDARRARVMTELFENCWRIAEADPNFRRLSL